MKGEKLYMKLLKIENNIGQYSVDGTDYREIQDISKEDILVLVNKVLEDDVEIDEITDVNDIKSPAQKIIYNRIYTKLNELIASKQEILDKNQKIFADAYAKYKFEDEK